MENPKFPQVCTLEDLRNPERRAAYEEANSAKALQKSLSVSIEEAKEALESFKQQSHNCNQEILLVAENQEKELSLMVPQFQSEIERLIDFFRNEMVTQNSENLKLYKQIQGLNKESSALQQITTENEEKIYKCELSLQLK